MRMRAGHIIAAASVVAVACAIGSPAEAKGYRAPACDNPGAITKLTPQWTGIRNPPFPADDATILGDNTPTHFAVDAYDPNVIFADNGATLFRSEDAGCNWTQSLRLMPPLTDSLAEANGFLMGSITVARNRDAHSTVYVVLQRPYASLYPSAALLAKSTDSGKTWSILQLPVSFGSYVQLVVAPSDPNRLYVAATSGLYGPASILASTDAGNTWSVVSVRNGRMNSYDHIVMAVDPLDAKELWFWPLMQRINNETIDAPENVFHSTDGGANWAPVFPHENGVFRVVVNHAPGSPASLLAVSYDREEMLRSDDGGQSFSRIPLPGRGMVMAYGRSANKFMVVTQKGSNGYDAGVFRYDARVSGGAWVNISPPNQLAEIGPSCFQLVGEFATTEVKPYPIFAMGQRGCSGEYPIARFTGRL